MKNLYKTLLLTILIQLPCWILSQEIPFTLKTGGFTKEKITIYSGDFQELKQVKAFNAIMKIENMRIGNKKHDPDSIYIKRRVSELNANKKGSGDEWLNEWEDSKKNYLPVFVEGYNAKISKTNVPKISTNESAEYLIILHHFLFY